MASGPCGSQFKEAFSCFHYSKEEVKGSECISHFSSMQECMQKYPDLYPQEGETENSSGAESNPVSESTDDNALLSENNSAPSSSGISDSLSPTDDQTVSSSWRTLQEQLWSTQLSLWQVQYESTEDDLHLYKLRGCFVWAIITYLILW